MISKNKGRWKKKEWKKKKENKRRKWYIITLATQQISERIKQAKRLRGWNIPSQKQSDAMDTRTIATTKSIEKDRKCVGNVVNANLTIIL